MTKTPRARVDQPHVDSNHDIEPPLIAAGPWSQGEFASLRDLLDPHGRWPTAATLSEAVDQIAHRDPPIELVLLAQPRPDSSDQHHVDRLAALAPLVRVVAIAGSWCEGELRTGRPLQGVVRLYWHEFEPWWRHALDRLARREAPPWSAPLGEPRAGSLVYAANSKPPGDVANLRGDVVINARDYAAFEAIAAALRPCGWTSRWQPRPARTAMTQLEGPSAAAIWDGAQLDPGELSDLRKFCRSLADSQTPVIALVDFPRPEHIELATSAGAAMVIGKPYQVALLAQALERLTSVSRRTSLTTNP